MIIWSYFLRLSAEMFQEVAEGTVVGSIHEACSPLNLVLNIQIVPKDRLPP
jgi:hypothetical protein